jgi:L-2,4-diaminobutyric acid acetyltransferase
MKRHTPWQLRHPTTADGPAIYRLCAASKHLDVNSPYHYLLMSHYFSQTCLVATDGHEVLGAAIGFIPPTEPRSLFIWQIAVHPSWQGRGLATRMLDELCTEHARRGVNTLQATVTPDNKASDRLFRAFARRQNAACRVTPCFSEESFVGSNHAPEYLYRIGPFTTEISTSLCPTPTTAAL